jgi:hypothetical protein
VPSRRKRPDNATTNSNVYICMRCTERFYAGKSDKTSHCGICEPRFPPGQDAPTDWRRVPPRRSHYDPDDDIESEGEMIQT